MDRPEAHIRSHARLLAVMGNEKRLHVLFRLLEGEVNVGVLAKEVGLSQSALSQHLAKLRKHGLVSTRREAQIIFYSTNNESAKRVIEALDKLTSGATPPYPPNADHDGVKLARRSLLFSQMREFSNE